MRSPWATRGVGVTLPKLFIFWSMDQLTHRDCSGLGPGLPRASCPRSKDAALGSNACTALGGECVVTRDGFYPLAYGMALAGILMGLSFRRVLPKLEALPVEVWRARSRKLR